MRQTDRTDRDRERKRQRETERERKKQYHNFVKSNVHQ